MTDIAQSVFITSSGTGIGKTHMAEILVRRWRGAGCQVTALKPVMTGFDPADADSSDTGRLLAALGKPLSEENLDRISPWRFAAPLSPDMAAARENRTLPYGALLSFCRQAMETARQNGARFLIEGIGGVMVPLDHSRTVLDLIADLSLPALLVTGSYLGSLSHTLTAHAVLRQRGISIDRIVISETPDSTVGLLATRITLRRFVNDTPIEVLPFTKPAW